VVVVVVAQEMPQVPVAPEHQHKADQAGVLAAVLGQHLL
jgi:hypothetical protein